MSHSEHRDPLWRIPDWFPWLSTEAKDLLRAYHIDLCKWTKAVNLISPGTIYEADKVHIADAILGGRLFLDVIPNGSEIWDLGSGNGIPGVVLSILRGDCRVICVDSDDRKMSFVKQFGLKSNLKNLEVRVGRLEDLNQQCISFGTARGLAALEKLLNLSFDVFSSGGNFFCFKGPELEKEMSHITNTTRENWDIGSALSYNLPENGGTRSILMVKRK